MRAPRSSAAAAPCALPVPAANRSSKRVSGGDPLDSPRLRDFLNRCGQCRPWLCPVSVSSSPPGALSFVCSPLPRLRRNTREFDAEGRVLRLKRFIPADCRPQVIDAVLDALTANTRVEVLYIQNFEQGFGDDQLLRLLDVLKLGRIWAVNVGENFQTSLPTWREFAAGLKDTDVQYMCVASCARSGAPADVLFCAPQVRVRAPLPAHRPEDSHAGRHPGEPPRAEARPRPGGHPLCGQHVVQSEGGGCEGGASQHGGQAAQAGSTQGGAAAGRQQQQPASGGEPVRGEAQDSADGACQRLWHGLLPGVRHPQAQRGACWTQGVAPLVRCNTIGYIEKRSHHTQRGSQQQHLAPGQLSGPILGLQQPTGRQNTGSA